MNKNKKTTDIDSIMSGAEMAGLSDESKKLIAEAFDAAVEARTEQRLDVALKSYDEKYSTKVKTLLETIDDKYTERASKMLKMNNDKRDKQCLTIIKKLNDKHNNVVLKEARKFQKDIVGKLSTFLEARIDKHIPTDMLNEAVSNTKATIVLKELRGHLAIDSALEQQVIREGLQDGKQQIETLNESVKTLSQENKNLQAQVDQSKRTSLLNKKLKGSSPAKIKHVTGVFNKSQDKSYNYLAENIDLVIEMFDNNEANVNAEYIAQAKTKRGKEQSKSSKKAQQILAEQNHAQAENIIKEQMGASDVMDMYAGGLG